MPPRSPRRRTRPDAQPPRRDARGRFVGGFGARGHLEADALHADPAHRATEGEALGKRAVLEAEPVGRITDIIFELATGDIVAYEFTDDAGAPHYLPASALARETGSELQFPVTARALISHDLPGLGDALHWDEAADAGEFTIVEDVTDRSR